MGEHDDGAPIALVLSGGGIRAMVFHLGVLRFLAEYGLLEKVSKISTVSGGSLVVGLIMHENGLKWPSSSSFCPVVLPRIKAKLCQRSMMIDALSQLIAPKNWKFVLSRANLLALALERKWGIIERLSDLPALPEWSINGTTAETGKRFRFKRENLGDYQLGYAEPLDFPLAKALAVSAAFPGGFGPLALDSGIFCWKKKAWDAPKESEQVVAPAFKRLHLYDGGVYDNLGLEPYFDAGRGASKLDKETILVSDAGAPLQQGFSPFALNPWRFKRVVDIMSDQSRSLRVRTFAHYIQAKLSRGALIYINATVKEKAARQNAELAVRFPTSLRRLKELEFDALESHGYQMALEYEREYTLLGYPLNER